MISLTDALQKLFGNSDVTQPFGVLDQATGQTHNGIDIGLPANANVYAAASGTVVANQGAQISIQSAPGVIESYLHIIQQNLPIGTKVQQGQIIGNVTPQTGLPYTAGTGYGPTVAGTNEVMPYWATGPHLHFSITGTVMNALSDTGGVNPVPYLEQFASGITGAVSSVVPNESQTTPLSPGGGNVAQTTQSATPILTGFGDGLGQFGNLMDSIFGGPKIPTSTQEAQDDLTAGLKTIWGSVGKYVAIGALLLFGGLLVLELFKGGTNVTVKETP